MSQGSQEFQGYGDRDLVLHFKAGGQAAYDEIFRRYRARVEVTCTRLVGRQDAEEATQETFLRAFQALPRFNGQFYLSAWLTRIATNVCVDLLRSRSRTNLIILPEVPETELQSGPEELVAVTSPRLERTIGEVQPSHARALALRALVGLSHNEMANRLAMSPEQVKSLLHRARSSFKRAWEQAEGWLMAPLLALRNLIDDRPSSTGSGIAGASPMLSSITVERVATSVIIMATALGAAPSAPPATAPFEGFGSVQAGESLDPRSTEDAFALANHDRSGKASDRADVERLEIPALIDVLADTVREAPKHDASASDSSDEQDQGNPGGAESREALRKARDLAAKTAEFLNEI
jgi:RNA polymerase sigma-70 factor (ECF subfamily)